MGDRPRIIEGRSMLKSLVTFGCTHQKGIQIIIVIVAWWISGASYLGGTVTGQQHDIVAHLNYTMWLKNTGRFPNPRDGGEKFHPPGFYLFNQLFLPGNKNVAGHIQRVRFANFYIFGTIFVIFLLQLAQKINTQQASTKWIVGVTTLWVVTTPALINTFTSYNNDAMSVGLACLAVIGSIKFIDNIQGLPLRIGLLKNWGWLLCILGSGYLAMHTKYSSGAMMIATIISICYLTVLKNINYRASMLVVLALVTSGLSIFHWAVVHNYKYTKELFPSAYIKGDESWMDYANLKRYGGYPAFILTPPFTDLKNWETPFVYNNKKYPEENYWTKQNISESLLITGLFGEWDHTISNERELTLLGWIIIGTFLTLIIWSTKPQKIYTWEAYGLLLIITSIMAGILYQLPFINAANTRYLPWIWVFPLLLIIGGFYQEKANWKRIITYTMLSIGIISNISFTLLMNRGENP